MELSRDRLAAAVVARCRNDHVEPPAPGQVRQLVGKAVKDFEKRFCHSTLDRLSHATRSRLEDLIAGDGTEQGTDGDGAVTGGGRSHFTDLKSDPGAPGLESLLAEVNKLEQVRRLELPADLFADVSEKLVDAWRARASKEYPANLERMKPPRRLTLLATLCHLLGLLVRPGQVAVLGMNSRLQLDLTSTARTVPGPRNPQGEAEDARSAAEEGAAGATSLGASQLADRAQGLSGS